MQMSPRCSVLLHVTLMGDISQTELALPGSLPAHAMGPEVPVSSHLLLLDSALFPGGPFPRFPT